MRHSQKKKTVAEKKSREKKRPEKKSSFNYGRMMLYADIC